MAAASLVLTILVIALAWRAARRQPPSAPPHGRHLLGIAALLVLQVVVLDLFAFRLFPTAWIQQAGSLFGLGFATQALRVLWLLSAFRLWLGIAGPELTGRARRIVLVAGLAAAGWGAAGMAVMAFFLQLWLASRMVWPRELVGWRRALALLVSLILLILLTMVPTTTTQGGFSASLNPAPAVWPPRLVSDLAPAGMRLELDLVRPLDRAIQALVDLFRAQLVVLLLRALTLPLRLSGMSLKRRFMVNYVLVRQIPGVIGALVFAVGAYFAFGVFRAEQARGAFERTLARGAATARAVLDDPGVAAGGAGAGGRLTAARAWLGPDGQRAQIIVRDWTDAVRDSAANDTLPPPHPPVRLSTPELPAALASATLPRPAAHNGFVGVVRADQMLYLTARVIGEHRAVDVCVPMDSLYLTAIARTVHARVRLYREGGVSVNNQGIRFSSNMDTAFARGRMLVAASAPDSATAGQRVFMLSRSFLPYGDWTMGWRFGTRGALVLELRATRGLLLGTFREIPGWLISNIFTVLVLIGLVTLTGMTEGLAVRSGRTIVQSVIDEVGQLRAATERFGAGDLSHRVPVRGRDELSALASSFNDMAANLERQRVELIEKERLEEDLEVARQIQKRFLPQSAPVVAGLDVAGLSVPSREVGGDLFYYLVQPGGRLAVALGDVSGKSVPAALLMSNVMSALRAEAQHETEVEKSLTHINRLIIEQIEPGRFVTLFYGVLDPAAGRVRYASAGHNPALRVGGEGTAEWLRDGGVPLGVVADASYEAANAVLTPGDVVVIYSDGVTEAEGPLRDGQPELFGEDRLVACVTALRTRPAGEIVQGIFEAVQRFAGDRPQADDITLVVARRTS